MPTAPTLAASEDAFTGGGRGASEQLEPLGDRWAHVPLSGHRLMDGSARRERTMALDTLSFGHWTRGARRSRARCSVPVSVQATGLRCTKNRPEYFELLFGAARAGAVLVGLNWRLAVPEIGAIADDAGLVLAGSAQRDLLSLETVSVMVFLLVWSSCEQSGSGRPKVCSPSWAEHGLFIALLAGSPGALARQVRPVWIDLRVVYPSARAAAVADPSTLPDLARPHRDLSDSLIEAGRRRDAVGPARQAGARPCCCGCN